MSSVLSGARYTWAQAGQAEWCGSWRAWVWDTVGRRVAAEYLGHTKRDVGLVAEAECARLNTEEAA